MTTMEYFTLLGLILAIPAAVYFTLKIRDLLNGKEEAGE